ncbi:MAG TPA: PAS domain-containing protein [Myxococcales bacterium]|nr:PAS domain-containing protein [Myxococcales bacterium]
MESINTIDYVPESRVNEPIHIEQLKWLTLVRVVLISVLLGATIVFNLRDDQGTSDRFFGYLYTLCTTFYILSFVYTVATRMFKTNRQLQLLTYFQLSGDCIMASALILVTGTTGSVFTFVFLLVIIAASTILFRPGAIFVASMSSGCVVLMGLTEIDVLPYFELFNSYQLSFFIGDQTLSDLQQVRNMVYNCTLNVVAFYAVAFLASRLSEQVRRSRVHIRLQQERLIELRVLHYNVVNSLPTGLMTLDLEHRVSFVNEAGLEITGLEASELIGKDVTHYFRDLKVVLANPHKIKSSNREESLIISGRRRVYLGWSVSSLRDASDSLIGHTFMFQDITRVKEMERLIKRSEKLAAVGELAAAIAHEIRNPLAAISGSTQMLKANAPLDEDDQRLLNIVLRETDQLNDWINDFLSYSRPTRAEFESVDLDRLVDESLSMFGKDGVISQASIVKKSQGPLYINGDASSLRQVIWNLLKNAAESMEKGGRIDVELSSGSDRDARSARLIVGDQGCGISVDEQENIFRPFVTTKDRGTGLGLSIVHRIIEDHDGRIDVKSIEGEGTVFSIHIPLSNIGVADG